MAERGALSLLSLLCLTFLHTAAKHVDKGKGFLRTAGSPLGSASYSCASIEGGKRGENAPHKTSFAAEILLHLLPNF